MICHRSGDKGNEVGPNLETVRQWDAEKIMANILDPNREVAPNFVSYEIEMKDGASLSGIIVSETAGSISLKRSDGIQETVLRQNIQKISSSGLSLMPEGLEAAIQPEDMADLVSFLLTGIPK
jgi:putative heme-binding domain-containing protein